MTPTPPLTPSAEKIDAAFKAMHRYGYGEYKVYLTMHGEHPEETIRARLAHLEAEVARKDEALREISEQETRHVDEFTAEAVAKVLAGMLYDIRHKAKAALSPISQEGKKE